jgi:hypothetical protein
MMGPARWAYPDPRDVKAASRHSRLDRAGLAIGSDDRLRPVIRATTTEERKADMGQDLLDELADFCSTEPDLRRQPDPVVLRGLVASLRAVRDEARSLGVPDDFLHTMIEGFVEGFRRLDGLPRDDPFWAETNRRPTRFKMGDFCRKLAEDDPEYVQLLMMQSAVQVLVGHYFDPITWRRLISCGRAGVSWALYAALMGIHFGGYETAPAVMQFLDDSGLYDEAQSAIDLLAGSDVPWVREWAETIVRGSEDRTR